MTSELDRAIIAYRADPDNAELQRKVNELARESVTRFYQEQANDYQRRTR